MKLAVFSDVHGNVAAFRAFLAAVPDRIDQLLFLGDLAGYYPFVNECVELWDHQRTLGILGNHDDVLLSCLNTGSRPDATYESSYGLALTRALEVLSPAAEALLRSWPVSRSVTIGGATIAMFHGAPWDALNGRVYPDFNAWERFDKIAADFILLGHTHYPLLHQRNDRWIANPGSVGQARDRSSVASFAEIDLEGRSVKHHRVPYDSSAIQEDARRHNSGLPYLVEVLTR